MSSNSRLFWDRLFKIVVLVGTPLLGGLYFSQHTGDSVGKIEQIVPFRVEKAPSLNGLLRNGKLADKLELTDWKTSRITVINFWATWCPPCVEEMPSMAELAARLKPLGVDFRFVSVDEDWAKVETFLQENIIDLPESSLFWDPKKEVALNWKSEKYPETYIVNHEGWVLERIVGFQDWTRPSVVSYFEKLAEKYASRGDLEGEVSMKINNILKSLAFMALPVTYAQDKGAVPLIHEDDKKNLGKLQQNVETSNKNVSKIEAAIKEENRSLREVKIKVERQQKDRAEVAAQLAKVKDSLSEVDRVRKKNDDSLASEKLERERVQKEAEALQLKLKDLEKELNRTRDDVILTNQKMSTRLQNIESFEKALASSKEEIRSLKDREKKLTSNIKKEEDIISEMERDASKRDSKMKSLERDLAKWLESLDKEKQKLIEFEKLLK